MTKQEAIVKAVERFGVLRFFPSDAGAREEIMRILDRMIGTNAELQWLADAMVNHGIWEGPGNLRGLFCTRYRPRDGVEAECSISGYAPVDLEAAYISGPPPTPHALIEAYMPQRALESGKPEPDVSLEAARKIPAARSLVPIKKSETHTPSELQRIANGFPTPPEKLSTRALEQQISAALPTLTEADKQRRVLEIEMALGVRGAG